MAKRINSITISALDRKFAGDFTQPNDCLLATALKRRGHKGVHVGLHLAFADNKSFTIKPYFGSKEACWKRNPVTNKGRYGKKVIGTKLRLIEN